MITQNPAYPNLNYRYADTDHMDVKRLKLIYLSILT